METHWQAYTQTQPWFRFATIEQNTHTHTQTQRKPCFGWKYAAPRTQTLETTVFPLQAHKHTWATQTHRNNTACLINQVNNTRTYEKHNILQTHRAGQNTPVFRFVSTLHTHSKQPLPLS